ncbi:MAG: hypothetical protein ACXWDN_02775 [Limisphaerales bacterium]
MSAKHLLPEIKPAPPHGHWVRFLPDEEPVLVQKGHWIGFDLDGTLSRTDNPGHFEPPYPIGEPFAEMLAVVSALKNAGVQVKIFTARACEPGNVPLVQAWARKHGLGDLAVTHQKDYDLLRFYDDRAIQIRWPGTMITSPAKSQHI